MAAEDTDVAAAVLDAASFYEVFGVSARGFDETVVRKAYRKLTMKLHPDKVHRALLRAAATAAAC